MFYIAYTAGHSPVDHCTHVNLKKKCCDMCTQFQEQVDDTHQCHHLQKIGHLISQMEKPAINHSGDKQQGLVGTCVVGAGLQ